MAHTLAVNELVEMRWGCLNVDQVSQTVRHYSVTSIAGASVTDADVATALSSSFGTVISPLLSSNCSYLGMRVQVIKPTRFIEQSSTNGAGAGFSTGDALPPATCGRLRLYTSSTGKRFRGRVYVPFPSEARNNANGNPDGTYITALNTLGNYLIQVQTVLVGVNGASLTPVIYSRVGGNQTFITTYQSISVWSTNRHRSRIGHGDKPFP